MLVEELLELLITEVDTTLLKTIEVKNIKISNVQATIVLYLLHGGVKKCFITLLYNAQEQVLIDFMANTRDRAGRDDPWIPIHYQHSTWADRRW